LAGIQNRNRLHTELPAEKSFPITAFGHTGYTGTSVWADADKNLIVIFLTNRVYPSRDNNGIREIRPEIHNFAVDLLNEQK
jgi:CubicO group peptidase (beta-lactamase class C family)